jgi:hypothetical protein
LQYSGAPEVQRKYFLSDALDEKILLIWIIVDFTTIVFDYLKKDPDDYPLMNENKFTT